MRKRKKNNWLILLLKEMFVHNFADVFVSRFVAPILGSLVFIGYSGSIYLWGREHLAYLPIELISCLVIIWLLFEARGFVLSAMVSKANPSYYKKKARKRNIIAVILSIIFLGFLFLKTYIIGIFGCLFSY